MHRAPYGGRSKATATTQCQKCLKRGHYSYECKVTAQERPYKSRPSRTQQLLNPKLKPKLTEDVPNDLTRKKGIADEILAQKEEERGRQSDRGNNRQRSRSYSSDSVSTISTNRSPSRSPSPRRHRNSLQPSARNGDARKKRARSTSSDRYSSHDDRGRHARRRLSSFSPPQRGRSGRSSSSRMDVSNDPMTRGSKRRTVSRSRSRSRRRRRRSYSFSRSPSAGPTHSNDRVRDRTRNHSSKRSDRATRRQMSSSPAPRPAESAGAWERKRTSFEKDRSPSPYSARRQNPDSRRNNPRNGNDRGQLPPAAFKKALSPARERSLSPYSKRVMMTQAMRG